MSQGFRHSLLVGFEDRRGRGRAFGENLEDAFVYNRFGDSARPTQMEQVSRRRGVICNGAICAVINLEHKVLDLSDIRVLVYDCCEDYVTLEYAV